MIFNVYFFLRFMQRDENEIVFGQNSKGHILLIIWKGIDETIEPVHIVM